MGCEKTMTEEVKTHLTRVCPFCNSLRYRKKVENIDRRRVRIFYICERCGKTFQSHRMIEIKTLHSNTLYIKNEV